MEKLKTVVVGAYGKMGREVSKGIVLSPDFQLVGAIDAYGVGTKIGEVLGVKGLDLLIETDLIACLERQTADVVIDFSQKEAAAVNVAAALRHKTAVVMGTTGFTPEELEAFNQLAIQNQVGMFFAPNFSLGAVLMMKYARELAKYFPQAEILEYHNDKKKDSPSGTALATARGMRELGCQQEKALNYDAAARGGEFYGYQIHSIRLKSLVAHQEVVFAGGGELLTISHDSFNRECFIPGVLLAARQVTGWKGLHIGLESILDYFANPIEKRSV